MKKFVLILCIAVSFAGISICSSCSGKASYESLTEKFEKAEKTDKTPDFSEAEYAFMLQYLKDNFAKQANDYSDDFTKEDEFYLNCWMYLDEANDEGKLPKSMEKEYKQINKKLEDLIGRELEALEKEWDNAFLDLDSDDELWMLDIDDELEGDAPIEEEYDYY